MADMFLKDQEHISHKINLKKKHLLSLLFFTECVYDQR